MCSSVNSWSVREEKLLVGSRSLDEDRFPSTRLLCKCRCNQYGCQDGVAPKEILCCRGWKTLKMNKKWLYLTFLFHVKFFWRLPSLRKRWWPFLWQLFFASSCQSQNKLLRRHLARSTWCIHIGHRSRKSCLLVRKARLLPPHSKDFLWIFYTG